MAELWQVISGQRPGRANDEQITLFKSVGTALQDLSLAIAVYRRACERGIGRDAGEFPHIRPFGRQ
jgi:ornithine cyclodeaminase/alanine dehydrogenase-like protein (mu-crystallin family)